MPAWTGTRCRADFGHPARPVAFNAARRHPLFSQLTAVTRRRRHLPQTTDARPQEAALRRRLAQLETLSSRGLERDSGDYVVKANPTADDGQEVISERFFFRLEGDRSREAGNVSRFGLTAGPYRSTALQVLWFGDWDNPDLDKGMGAVLDDEVWSQGEQIGPGHDETRMATTRSRSRRRP